MCRLLIPCVLVVGAYAGEGSLLARCNELLLGVGQSGSSDDEIAAYCRASYPPVMCRTMHTSLGSLPWQTSSVDSTCKELKSRLDALPADRRAMSYQEVQSALDQSARKKSEMGYDMPKDSAGNVDLDKTVKMKYEQTQKMQKTMTDYMYGSDSTSAVEGIKDTGKKAVDGLKDMMGQKYEQGTVTAHNSPLVTIFTSVSLTLGAALVVGGSAMLVRRAARVSVKPPQAEEAVVDSLLE